MKTLITRICNQVGNHPFCEISHRQSYSLQTLHLHQIRRRSPRRKSIIGLFLWVSLTNFRDPRRLLPLPQSRSCQHLLQLRQAVNQSCISQSPASIIPQVGLHLVRLHLRLRGPTDGLVSLIYCFYTNSCLHRHGQCLLHRLPTR